MDRRPPLAVSPRRLRPRPHRVPRPPLVPAASVQVQTPPGSMKKAAAAAAATPMRASVCAMRSPVRFEPSQMRASISALPSPIRADRSPMRASISALSSAIRGCRSPMRASMTSALQPPRRVKLDLAPAADKENFVPAAAPSMPPPAKARAGFEKESLHLPAGADAHDEQLWLDLAAIAREGEAGPPVFVRSRNYDRYAALREERLRRKQGFPYYDSFAPAASILLDPEAMAEDPCFAVELPKRRVAKKAYTAASGAESVRRSMPAVDFAAGCSGGLGPRSSLRAAASVSVDPEAMAEDPCVAVELSKRRVAKKAYTAASGSESVRRSMPAVDFAAGRGGGLGPRSSLRTSKEMKKASATSGAVSVAIKERRIAPRSSARRF